MGVMDWIKVLAVVGILFAGWPAIQVAYSMISEISTAVNHGYHFARASRSGLNDDMIDPASVKAAGLSNAFILDENDYYNTANTDCVRAGGGKLLCSNVDE